MQLRPSLKNLKSLTLSSGLIGIIAIAACGSPTPETKPSPSNPFPNSTSTSDAKSSNSNVNPNSSTNAQSNGKSNEKEAKSSVKANYGGQVVAAGAYNLELVTINEETGVHIDLYVYSGSDNAPIPDAKVNAQVQLPNGSKKTLDMPYKVDGKHYGGLLNETLTGEYKVVILSDIKGEKINGRFGFKR